jgi:hypothetical protein
MPEDYKEILAQKKKRSHGAAPLPFDVGGIAFSVSATTVRRPESGILAVLFNGPFAPEQSSSKVGCNAKIFCDVQ